ncbi:MAG: ParB/RepB/Spo0J family partition protein [Sedimentisphaerales bacterium]
MNEQKTNLKSVQFEELQVVDIIPSGDNPRTINERSEVFIELTESIKAQGVIVPVHVRIHPKQKSKFELLAGERRWLASVILVGGTDSVKAEKATIPAINHGTINDEQAFEITFTENYAREDLTPIEQGRAVVTLLEKYKGDAEAVASKMGKSIKWVRQRQALGTKLSQKWKKALTEEISFQGWTASHLQRVAALPEPTQSELLEEYEYNEQPTLKQLDAEIAEMLQLLSKAPFEASAAGCTKCPKRTSCQPGLFDDNLEPEALKKNDRCLDKSCWQQKTLAWLKEQFAAQKKELPGLVAITTEATNSIQDRMFNQTWGRFFENYLFNQAAKKDKGAMPGFIIHGKALGTVLWIKLKGTSAESSAKKATGKPTSLKERRQMLHNKRMARFLEVMIKEIKPDYENEKNDGKKVSDLVAPDKTTMVMALARIFGVVECYEHATLSYRGDKEILNAWETLEKLLAADLKTIRETLWNNIRPKLEQSLVYAGPITQTPPHRVTAAEKLAAIFGIDYKAMQQKITTEMPEPKSWTKLDADGTPKKAKKAKEKPAKEKKTAKSKQKKGGKKNAKP